MSPPCVVSGDHSAGYQARDHGSAHFDVCVKWPVASVVCCADMRGQGGQPHWSLDPACEACEPCADWGSVSCRTCTGEHASDIQVIICENGNKFKYTLYGLERISVSATLALSCNIRSLTPVINKM